MKNWVFGVCWILLSPVFRLIYRRKATGLENVPKEGGYILCANHCSAIDPVYIASSLPLNTKMYFIAKKELFSVKPFAWLIRKLGGFPVDRGNADLAAVRMSLQYLKDGNALCIFPQGTRSRDNSPMPMQTGAAMIALRAGVSVIPCYIDGPYRLFRRVAIRYGKPVELSDFGRCYDRDTLEQATARIEKAVWSLREIQD